MAKVDNASRANEEAFVDLTVTFLEVTRERSESKFVLGEVANGH